MHAYVATTRKRRAEAGEGQEGRGGGGETRASDVCVTRERCDGVKLTIIIRLSHVGAFESKEGP